MSCKWLSLCIQEGQNTWDMNAPVPSMWFIPGTLKDAPETGVRILGNHINSSRHARYGRFDTNLNSAYAVLYQYQENPVYHLHVLTDNLREANMYSQELCGANTSIERACVIFAPIKWDAQTIGGDIRDYW